MASSGVAAEWLTGPRLLAARHPDDENLTGILFVCPPCSSPRGACTRVGDPESIAQEEELLAEARTAVGSNRTSTARPRLAPLRLGERARQATRGGPDTRGPHGRRRTRPRPLPAPRSERPRTDCSAGTTTSSSRPDWPSRRRRPKRQHPPLCARPGARLAGHSDEAAAEGLSTRSALAENPLGQPVVTILLTLAQVMEDTDQAASLRLTVLVEDLFDLQATTLDSPGEAVGFGEVEHHRDVVADLVSGCSRRSTRTKRCRSRNRPIQDRPTGLPHRRGSPRAHPWTHRPMPPSPT